MRPALSTPRLVADVASLLPCSVGKVRSIQCGAHLADCSAVNVRPAAVDASSFPCLGAELPMFVVAPVERAVEAE